MTPQDQEFIYIKDVQYGDCMRACIASLLDLPIADVPHFLRDADGKSLGFWDGIYDFLEARGYEYCPSQRLINPPEYHIIVSPSPRDPVNISHAVVGRNGSIVFDPHSSRDGLHGDPKNWKNHYLVKA